MGISYENVPRDSLHPSVPYVTSAASDCSYYGLHESHPDKIVNLEPIYEGPYSEISNV